MREFFEMIIFAVKLKHGPFSEDAMVRLGAARVRWTIGH